MVERIEMYSTKDGGEHTATTEAMKEAAWKAAGDLGLVAAGSEGDASKGTVRMTYSPKAGAYAMNIDGASAETVEAFKTATAPFRTDEAKAEMSAKLTEVREDRAANPVEKAPKAEKAPKEPKEPELPRSDVAIYPLPVGPGDIAEGQSPEKAASAKMLGEADKLIDSMGLKDSVKNSFDRVAGNWRMGGRGLSEETVKGLEDGMAKYRTPEAESAWRDAAPARAEARATGAKGPAEGVDVAAAAMAKGGAER